MKSRFYKSLKSNSIKIALILGMLFTYSATWAQPDGAKLFKANCASCHKITDQKLVGPGLAGVEDRWGGDRTNLKAWIKNSTEYLKTGDAYAVKLFEEYNKSVMPAQALSDEEIDAVLDYVKAGPVAAPGGPAPTVETAPAAPAPDYSMYWLIGFAIVFALLIKILVDIRRSIAKVINEVNVGQTESVDGFLEGSKKWLIRNKIVTALIVVFILAFGASKLWDTLLGVGVYEGYAPEQPIKFSHKIHAGDNAINCVYCHSSAEKGKHSGIPSVNVCMNCHRGIQQGKMYGTEEIAKIYDAAGWNPETSSYDKPEKPIQWVRIHNLPDHVYFNHSQHVVVGKVECQTCHGEVQETGYPMVQAKPLTMGWCINCHRETNVKMEGNAYYDKMHEELKEAHNGQEVFSVEDIGGTECAKCHY